MDEESAVEVATIAQRFATALDHEDYRALADLLSDDCSYESPKGVLTGPESILASYREAGLWAKSNIRNVSYESAVRADRPCSAIVTFIDHLEHHGLAHRYSCEQQVFVDGAGRVCRIIHRDIPGEREAVESYLRRIGVERNA